MITDVLRYDFNVGDEVFTIGWQVEPVSQATRAASNVASSLLEKRNLANKRFN